ncbi:MAG: hypothetical protein ACREUE_19975 [Panacagrimonas sp.]
MKPQTLARISLAALTALLSPLAARAQQAADRWTFAVTPYLWLPNVNGTWKYSVPPGAGGAPEVETGPNSYLENLEFALMLAGEARRGKWSIVTDVVYLDFENQKSSVRSVNFGGPEVDAGLNTSTRSSLNGVHWMLAGGYTVLHKPSVMLDVLGGFRYLRIEARTD